VSRRLDWDKVGREDRVRRHGSVSVYDGLPRAAKAKPWQTKTGIKYAAKLRPQLDAVVIKARSATPGDRAAAQEEALRQLKKIAAAERAQLTGAYRHIKIAVLDREVGRATDRVRSAPKKRKSKPAPAPLSRTPRTERSIWKLGPLPTSVQTSQGIGAESRLRIRGTLDELGLRLYWDPDERVDRWLLAVRRNGKVIRRESLGRCEWVGKVGPLSAIHTLEVRLTGMAGNRMVTWSSAGLSISRPKQRPKSKPNRRRGSRR
jgi:hypothetical protein